MSSKILFSDNDSGDSRLNNMIFKHAQEPSELYMVIKYDKISHFDENVSFQFDDWQKLYNILRDLKETICLPPLRKSSVTPNLIVGRFPKIAFR